MLHLISYNPAIKVSLAAANFLFYDLSKILYLSLNWLQKADLHFLAFIVEIFLYLTVDLDLNLF